MSTESYKLDWHDGWLCVVYSCPLYSEPVLIRHWWPVCRASKSDHDDIMDLDVHPIGPAEFGRFRVIKPGNRCVDFRLTDGGTTKPIHTETEPIPKPKTSRPVEYRNGQWWKHLKHGWKPA